MADYQETINRHYKKVNPGVKPWWQYYHELLDQLDLEIQNLFDATNEIPDIKNLLNNHHTRHEIGGEDVLNITGLKGDYISVDNIQEKTSDNGVIIDNLHIKDGRLYILEPLEDNEPASKKYMEEYVQQYVQGLDYQDSVKDKDLTLPPQSPANKDRYLLYNEPDTGTDWEGHKNDIAEYNGTEWIFITPNKGFTLEVEDENIYYNFNGTDWIKLSSTIQHNNTSGLQGGQSGEYYHFTNQEHSNILDHLQNEAIHRVIDDNNPSDITLYSGNKIEDRISNHTHTFQQIYDSQQGTSRVINFEAPVGNLSFNVNSFSFFNVNSILFKKLPSNFNNYDVISSSTTYLRMVNEGVSRGIILSLYNESFNQYSDVMHLQLVEGGDFTFFSKTARAGGTIKFNLRDMSNIVSLTPNGAYNSFTFKSRNGKSSILEVINEINTDLDNITLDKSYDNSALNDGTPVDRIINIDNGNINFNLSSDYYLEINRTGPEDTETPLFKINYYNASQGDIYYMSIYYKSSEEALRFDFGHNTNNVINGYISLVNDLLFFNFDSSQFQLNSSFSVYVGNLYFALEDKITTNTDIEIIDNNKGIILQSPSGNKFRIKVDDSGNLYTEAV